MDKKLLSEEIIEGYHRLIQDRYVYDKIVQNYDLPASVTQEKFELIRNYFLNYMYPSAEKRKELNDAFLSLDDHIKHPNQLLRIIVDSGGLLFRYGIHLPKILKAGLKALKSFRIASGLEDKLIITSLDNDIRPPFTVEDIHALIRSIPRSELDFFMEHGMKLFETLYDRNLVTKIIEIVDYLIKKMKKKPDLYTSEDVRGLEVGEEIIVEGNKLFDLLEPKEQELLFQLIYTIEKDALDKIYEEG
jgi:hypothetical protein